MAYEIGTLCTKNGGRDTGLWCVIVDLPKDGYALIDGQTRRRTVNIAHLIPSDKKVKLKKGASHSDVAAVLKELKIEVRERKPKKPTTKPLKQRRTKKAELKREAKKADKATKKAEAKKAEAKKKAAKAEEKQAQAEKKVVATEAKPVKAEPAKQAPAAKPSTPPKADE